MAHDRCYVYMLVVDRSSWVGEVDFVESLGSLSRGPTSSELRNLNEPVSEKIFHSYVQFGNRGQVFSFYPRTSSNVCTIVIMVD